jgi:catechol 2,3-dioxygenase-like lactoylglutathione lyase family enzyme
LRLLLLRRGLAPGDLREGRDGNLSFRLPDGEGNTLEFTEYRPTSNHTITRGQNAALPRISNRLHHAVIVVERRKLARFLDFYVSKLGFERAAGGSPVNNGRRCVNLRIPGARGDLLEAVLFEGQPTPRQAAEPMHLSFEAPDLAAAWEELRRRGLPAERRLLTPGRVIPRQAELSDPDGNVVQLVESARPGSQNGGGTGRARTDGR